ncbi:MAG: RCC1 domain-containing protein, partial [Myxococcota bacterium]|nr:RCC1 domain-containing protein [Myxococcota bacterium]
MAFIGCGGSDRSKPQAGIPHSAGVDETIAGTVPDTGAATPVCPDGDGAPGSDTGGAPGCDEGDLRGWRGISAGHSHTCGITADDRAVCWGGNGHGEASPPEGAAFTHVSAGFSHT